MSYIMAPTFPSIILLQRYGYAGSVAATGVIDGVDGAVHNDTVQGMYNPMGKIEIETAKVDSKYVHLRFTHTNKYWSRNNAQEGFVVAHSTVAEEDTSKPSCTLFEPVTAAAGGGGFHLVHVQGGGRVHVESHLLSRFVVISGGSNTDTFTALNSDSVVRLPPNVAFKGYNSKYLRYCNTAYLIPISYLHFLSDDPNEEGSVQLVDLQPDGSARIKCAQSGGFWRLQADFIMADSLSDTPDTRYLPLRGENNTIALKNTSNGFFCRSLTTELLTDVLSARAATMISEARMEVHELVSERSIHGVRYRTDEARIYNERPYLAGQSKLRNNTDQEASQTVSITYQDGKSYTFSRGFSLKAGVSNTISAGVPFIVKGEITVSFEISGTFNWDTTRTTTASVTASTTVTVPPRSTVVVKYLGTQGTCSIPYSYIQQDRRSTDGQLVNIPQTDGIYKGISCYNFDFQMDQVLPL